MGASDGALVHSQPFIYMKDFFFFGKAQSGALTEHRKFDAYEHYAAICEDHNALC